MAKNVRVKSPKVREQPPGMWSNAFVFGDQFVIAGMVASEPDGTVVGGFDDSAQAMQTFRNIQHMVEAIGAKMDDIVKMTIYLTDMRYRPAMVEARKKFFKDDFPCAVALGNTTLARAELLVEIDAIGFKGAGG